MIPKPLKPLLFLFFLLLPLTSQSAQWASDITIRPASPKVGDQVTFLLSVKAGPEGSRNLRISGGIDGDNRFRYQVPALKPNSTKQLRFKWKASAGEHTATFRFESRQTTPQQRVQTLMRKPGANNPLTLSRTFNVRGSAISRQMQPQVRERLPRQRPHLQRSTGTGAISTMLSPGQAVQQGMQQPTCDGSPLPDLVISHVSVSGNGYPGATHGINVTVQNRGQCDSGIFAVRVEVLEQVPARGIHRTREVGRKGFPSLKACRSNNCSEAAHSMSFDYTLLPDYHAYYDFSVEIDSTNSVDEFNEDNNSAHRIESIEVKGPEYYGQ